ncbi:MAG TPA: efflux RND transporter periplasmic adaptor subunit [Rhodopila sp.]|nr:efflux RND transporter periplasmic adaptor subunit [Rhodopila sp.]
MAGIAALVVAAVVTWGVIERQSNVARLTTVARQQATPKVALVSPKPGPTTRGLTLPGDVNPWYQADIYAQVSGYVKAWYKDYGATVHKGELLATISTPDLDQQLLQARAQLQVAKEKYALAVVTANRWKKLAGTDAVSQQTVDVNVASAKAEQAAVQAAEDNVERYKAQEQFKQIVAPFDGVVTARHTDIGNYVVATGGNAERRGKVEALFSVAEVDKLRIFVSVPQDYSQYIKPGVTATMTLSQFPGQTFEARLLTTARAFNMTSRTVLVELEVDNPKLEIWPGAYGEVHFNLPTPPNIVIIPEQSLLFRSHGLQVALVKDGKIHLQDVTVGLNFGTTVQVTQGLTLSDRLIANPSEGLLDGQPVQVVDAPPQNSNLGNTAVGEDDQASHKKSGSTPPESH